MKTTEENPAATYNSVEELLNVLWSSIRSVGDALQIAREENAMLIAKLNAQERELQKALQTLSQYEGSPQNIISEIIPDGKQLSPEEVNALRVRIQELIDIVDSHL